MTDRLMRDEVRTLIGRSDDRVVTDILTMGVSRAELAEALAWLENDEAMLNADRLIPSGHVARLIERLQADDEELPRVPKL
jgi:ribosome-binding protein aMBF1 (putative translation factor)